MGNRVASLMSESRRTKTRNLPRPERNKNTAVYIGSICGCSPGTYAKKEKQTAGKLTLSFVLEGGFVAGSKFRGMWNWALALTGSEKSRTRAIEPADQLLSGLSARSFRGLRPPCFRLCRPYYPRETNSCAMPLSLAPWAGGIGDF